MSRGRFILRAVLGGAIVVAAAFLAMRLRVLHRGDGVPREGSEATDGSPDAGGRGLAKGKGRPAPGLPADAIDVEVIEAEGGAPVAGLRLRLAASFSRADEPPEGAVVTTTDAGGRARIVGPSPGILEVVDPSWVAREGPLAVVAGTAVRVTVARRVAYRVALSDEKTGLPLAAWAASPMGPAHEAPRTDGLGSAELPMLRHSPSMIAAWDGGKRLHTFFLYSRASGPEVRLAVPPATKTTRIRAVDGEGRPVAGARVHPIDVETGIALDCDARGELDVEYAAGGIVVTVSAPNWSKRSVALEGQPVLAVALSPVTRRTFRLLRLDGTLAPDGTRVRGLAHGPGGYEQRAVAVPFAGTSEGGVVTVDGLPAGTFESGLEADGPGILAMSWASVPEDPSVVVDVRVGPPRTFAFRVVGPEEGVASAGTLWLRVGEASGCRSADGYADLLDDVRAGGSRVGTIRATVGPEARVDVPWSDRALGVEIADRDRGYACVRIEPGEDGGPREVRLARSRDDAASRTLTPMHVEFSDGSAAALQWIDIRRDESGATPRRAYTDSAGTAFLEETSGRYVVEATTADGATWESDAPILLPSREPIVVRLRRVDR